MISTKWMLIGCILLMLATLALARHSFQQQQQIQKLKDLNEDYLKDSRKAKLMKTRYDDLIAGNVTDVIQYSMWDAHLHKSPRFIFESLTIPLTKLYSNTDFIDTGKLNILGTFPTTCDQPGCWEAIELTNRKLILPDYGRYYLHTNFGFLKLLAIDPNMAEQDRLLEIVSFVSANTVHTLADLRYLNPIPFGCNKPANLTQLLFQSDQPLKLHCGPVSIFLHWMLGEMGYVAKIVSFKTEDEQGHMAIQVYLKEVGHWVFLDPDFGIYFASTSGELLSIEQVKQWIDSNQTDLLQLQFLTRKKKINSKYNQNANAGEGFLTPQFSWTPECMLHQDYVSESEYLDFLKRYTHEVNVQ